MKLDQAKAERARKALATALEDALRAGYTPMLVVSKPAPRRQVITMAALELKPMDGSDLSTCSCCLNQFEQLTRSRLLQNYLPLNWCPACRELLREGVPREGVLKQRGKKPNNGSRAAIRRCEERLLAFLRKSIPAWMLREEGLLHD